MNRSYFNEIYTPQNSISQKKRPITLELREYEVDSICRGQGRIQYNRITYVFPPYMARTCHIIRNNRSMERALKIKTQSHHTFLIRLALRDDLAAHRPKYISLSEVRSLLFPNLPYSQKKNLRFLEAKSRSEIYIPEFKKGFGAGGFCSQKHQLI